MCCREELYKKDLHDPDNHDGVITHLEPDILEGEVKWGERKRIKVAGTQRQRISFAFLPRFHPSALGFYADFSRQMAALET